MLSGGGTGGSVTPLLALAQYLEQAELGRYDFIFVGTAFGPEKNLVESAQIPFKKIASGKWRRYFSLKNLTDIFKIGFAFFQSLFLLRKYRPSLVISAGGFVSVPLAYAAYCYRIPVLIHQQDIRAGLANKLMAKVAAKVTVTFEKSIADYGSKALWTGNPIMEGKVENLDLWQKYNLDQAKPLLLVSGGGTGSVFINQLVENSLDRLLPFCQAVHITGAGKGSLKLEKDGYLQLEFIDHQELLWLMDKAQVLVSRCGLGALTEISYLGKPSILIPMPDSHQEDNAAIFAEQKAAIVLSEKDLTIDVFVSRVKELMENKKLRDDLRSLAKNVIKPANADMKKVIDGLI